MLHYIIMTIVVVVIFIFSNVEFHIYTDKCINIRLSHWRGSQKSIAYRAGFHSTVN